MPCLNKGMQYDIKYQLYCSCYFSLLGPFQCECIPGPLSVVLECIHAMGIELAQIPVEACGLGLHVQPRTRMQPK